MPVATATDAQSISRRPGRLRLPMPRALVIRTAGTNCDAELVRAFRMAGASAETLHLHQLVREPRRIGEFDLIGFPGGFSYGDDVASGRIFAVRARERLYPALRDHIQRGCPIIGVCNGFQVLVQLGLLPGPALGQPWPEDRPPRQTVALTDNISARFEDRWVPVEFIDSSRCIWTAGTGTGLPPENSLLPVAHGEGRLVTDEATLSGLLESGQVVLRYRENYNGSQGAVAGICDASGLVLGLMPHPERFLDWTRHPYWTRVSPAVRSSTPIGLQLFQNAVKALQKAENRNLARAAGR